MKFEIRFTPELDYALKVLMSDNRELNGGKEMFAWLMGDWARRGDTMFLTLDSLCIPEQKVSHAEVNTD